MKSLFTVLGMLCIPFLSVAQVQTHHLWEGSLILGGANYQGDMVDRAFPYLSETGPAFGLFGRYVLNPHWGVRGGFWLGKVSGTDENSERIDIATNRAFSFESRITEVSLKLEWEPFGHKRYNVRGEFQNVFSPFMYIGIGMSSFNTETDYSRADPEKFTEAIRIDAATPYPLSTFSIPAGIGFRADISANYALGVEFSTTAPFTDYIDGVSAAGNSDEQDWYQAGSVFVTRRFGQRDSDKDGIANREDACPFQPGTEETGGCPDQDGDLVADHIDLCPEQAGNKVTWGCPDSDGDKVPDDKDLCPNLPGLKLRDGCPDSDMDGVIDPEDECPDLKGSPEHNGCVRDDKDGDGVIDPEDKCPDLPGLKSFDGCPDRDYDGVIDPEDRCPETAGAKELFGCPKIKEADQALLEEAQRMVLFNMGSAVLKEESYAVLDQVAEVMNRYPDYRLRISGHTDNNGDAYANLILSERRAQACHAYLEEKGVDSVRMSYRGYGEKEPVAPNETKEGRRKNRRVVFDLYLY